MQTIAFVKMKRVCNFWLMLIFATSGFISSAQTLQTVCSFNGTNGANPDAAMTLGNDGNFYGTTANGGSGYSVPYTGRGTVFQVTMNGTLTTLVSFANTNGAIPMGALTLGNDGNFYGTTGRGGISDYGYGTIFRVATNGTLTTLVSFANTNGADPEGALTLGNDGSFYGTTWGGGNTNLNSGFGVGTIFRVTTNGTLTTLYSFGGGSDGGNSYAGLTLGDDGNFYGTTSGGGNTNLNNGLGVGTIFRVTTNGTLTTLVSFANTNGSGPHTALTLGNDGNFYGTTDYGGNTNLNSGLGFGTIFRVTTNGALTTLVYFNYTNGAYPEAALKLGNDGNFFGTTIQGGSSGGGTAFRLLLTPVVPPTLTLQFWSGYPLLNVYGTLGDTYTVQYATNLINPNWIPMLIVPNLSISPFQMIDPAGVGQPMRFYRAVQSQ